MATDKSLMKALTFYLNKLITENDSLFIINALENSNFDVKKDNDKYIVKINYVDLPKKELFKVDSTFEKDRIEIFIREKTTGLFNDDEIVSSSYLKERYALYESVDKDITLNFKQNYSFTTTNQEGHTSNIELINTEDKVELEFIQGEHNLISNYDNIRYKKKDKVLTKNK